MDVQALALANICATIRSEVDDLLLRDFPDGLVDGLDVVGDIGDLLDRATVGNDPILHVIVPELEVNKLTEQPRTDDLEFASEHTTSVNVAGENRD
jgi:hypothetical protein